MTTIRLHSQRCIAAGSCAELAPAVFELDDEGYARLLEPRPAPYDVEPAQEAAECCPARAITIDD